MRRGLTCAGFEIVAEEASGENVLERYDELRPSLIVLDIVLPGQDGVTLASEILRRHPKALVVVCSSITSREQVLACRTAGVAHFILKPFALKKVVEIVQALALRIGDSAMAKMVAEPVPTIGSIDAVPQVSAQ